MTDTKQDSSIDRKPVIYHLLCLVAICVAAYQAWQIRWLTDDCFVTFRYVENMLNGLGPVFNAGERVEGYTHFLWFALLTTSGYLGFNYIIAAQMLGVAAFVGTLLILMLISYRQASWQALPPPLAMGALLLNEDFRIWATGGLETALYTFLLTLSFYFAFIAKIQCVTRRLILCGICLALAAMTRPDGLLFVVGASALLTTIGIWKRERPRAIAKQLLMLNAAIILLWAPWYVWRWTYYGWPFPNTYYAKAAYDSQIGQGLIYLVLWFRVYWVSLLFLPAGVLLFVKLWRTRSESSDMQAESLVGFVATAIALCYLLVFTVRVGGDFMFGRFIIPVLPLMYMGLEFSLRLILGKRPRFYYATCIATWLFLVIAAPLLRSAIYPHHKKDAPEIADNITHHGIADEHWFYSAPIAYNRSMSVILMGEVIGRELRPYFAGMDVIMLLPSQNVIGYYGNFRHIIEGHGLVDEHIAHAPLSNEQHTNRRTGHIRQPSEDYIIERGMDFLLFTDYKRKKDYQVAGFIMPDGMRVPVTILTYERTIINELNERMADQFAYVDFEQYLDNYISTLSDRSREQIIHDLESFKKYYFIHSNDPGRLQSIEDYLAE